MYAFVIAQLKILIAIGVGKYEIDDDAASLVISITNSSHDGASASFPSASSDVFGDSALWIQCPS